MPFNTREKNGVVDLLETEAQNLPILFSLAKSITKNVTDILTTQEAFEYIFLHLSDSTALLHKKSITKEVLFKYLHSKKVSISADFTKAVLVQKVIDFWNATEDALPEDIRRIEQSYSLENNTLCSAEQLAVISSVPNGQQPIPSTSPATEAEFPINLLARKFSEWFFNNYNQNALKSNDFWQDAKLLLRITANDGFDEHNCDDAMSLLATLYETQQRFEFFFNPNLTHAGVQGRMDIHGLILVLACGTLHTQSDCVGLFECSFGLLRDPFSDNNWKTKNIQLLLRSKGSADVPSLQESDTLKEALSLPSSQEDIT